MREIEVKVKWVNFRKQETSVKPVQFVVCRCWEPESWCCCQEDEVDRLFVSFVSSHHSSCIDVLWSPWTTFSPWTLNTNDIFILNIEHRQHSHPEHLKQTTFSHWTFNTNDILTLNIQHKQHSHPEHWTQTTFSPWTFNTNDILTLNIEHKRHSHPEHSTQTTFSPEHSTQTTFSPWTFNTDDILTLNIQHKLRDGFHSCCGWFSSRIF